MSTLVAGVLAVAIVGFLTAAATAVRSVSRIWLRHWVERRLAGATLAEVYLERPQRLIVSAGLGIAITVFLAGTAVSAADAGLVATGVRLVSAAVAVVVLGQVVPRALARRWPARLVPPLIAPLRAVDLLISPVRAAGGWLARAVARRSNVPHEDEVRDNIEELLLEGAREGLGEKQEIAIIAGVVQFGEKTARDVMTPRDQIFGLDVATPPRELAGQIAAAGFSRVPLFQGTIDDIVGMVHVADVYKTAGETAPPLRAVAVAGPSTPCNELLFSMLRARRHIAVVRDGDGSALSRTLGIVTLEDVLEELVGDIRDEHDDPAPPDQPA